MNSDEHARDESQAPDRQSGEIEASNENFGETEASVQWVLPTEPIGSSTTEVVNPMEVNFSSLEPGPRNLSKPSDAGSEGSLVGLIRDMSERVDRKFVDLQAMFEREVRAESNREKVIDRLHAELQDYKQDLLLNTLRPVFIDLIQLHDDIGKVAVSSEDASDEVRRLIGLMRGFQEGIEDILYRQGVEPFENDGDQFDPRRQRAISTVSTEDPALVKRIAVRHRKGFQSGTRVIRPEVVSVHALKKPSERS